MTSKAVSGKFLYEQVVNTTYDYLGPAAERFISRQVEHHINKSPERLNKPDLKKLIIWISLAMNLLVDDQKLVAEYIGKLRDLTA